jgi:hypothetical protein
MTDRDRHDPRYDGPAKVGDTYRTYVTVRDVPLVLEAAFVEGPRGPTVDPELLEVFVENRMVPVTDMLDQASIDELVDLVAMNARDEGEEVGDG